MLQRRRSRRGARAVGGRGRGSDVWRKVRGTAGRQGSGEAGHRELDSGTAGQSKLDCGAAGAGQREGLTLWLATPFYQPSNMMTIIIKKSEVIKKC